MVPIALGKPMVPLATNGTIGKISNGTIGLNPEKSTSLVGWGRSFLVCWSANRGSTGDSLLLQIFSGVDTPWIFGCRNVYLSSPRLCITHYGTFRDLFVLP